MIRDTAAELRAIALSCDNAAGYFPAMYSRVTTQIANSIDADAFVDGERMNVFATEFASRYMPALGNTRSRGRGVGRHRGMSPTTEIC